MNKVPARNAMRPNTQTNRNTPSINITMGHTGSKKGYGAGGGAACTNVKSLPPGSVLISVGIRVRLDSGLVCRSEPVCTK